MGIKLLALAGPLAGRDFPLPPTATTLGADPFNHIAWADDQLSPHHAQIRWQEGGHVLTDLGSESGTFVNNQRIAAPYRLQPGDRIRIGKSTFLYIAPVQELAFPLEGPSAKEPASSVPAPAIPADRQQRRKILAILLGAIALLAALTFLVFPRLWRTLLPVPKPTATSSSGIPLQATSTATSPPTATPGSEAKPRYYPVPILLGPADGAVGLKMMLQWSWRGALDLNEWYEVWVWREGENPHSLAWTKVPQYEVGPGLTPGVYSWQVTVVQGVTEGQRLRDLSAPSEIRHFTLVSLTSTPTYRPTATPTATALPPTSTGTATPEPFVRIIISGLVYNAQRGPGAAIANAEVRVYLLERRVITRTDPSGRYAAEFRLSGQTAGQRVDLIASAPGYEPGIGYVILGLYPPNTSQYVNAPLALMPSPTPTPTWIPPTATPTGTSTPISTHTPTSSSVPTATGTPPLTDTPMATTVTPVPP